MVASLTGFDAPRLAALCRRVVVSLALITFAPLAWAGGGGHSGGGHSGAGLSPNDQRSNALNPNNSAYQSALDNRSNQLNPNNSAFRSSRIGNQEELGSPSGDDGLGPGFANDDGMVTAPRPPSGGGMVAPNLVPTADRPFGHERSTQGVAGWVLRGLGILGGGAFLAFLAMAAFVRSRRPF